MFEIVSMPVYATVPIGIASRKFVSVGVSPKNDTLSARMPGLKTSATPSPTIASWLQKSITASTRFTLTASLTPRTLTSASSATITAAQAMSPGDSLKASHVKRPA